MYIGADEDKTLGSRFENMGKGVWMCSGEYCSATARERLLA